MDEGSKQKYRRLRNGLGWALVAVWLLYRWYALSAEQAAALAAIQGCDGIFGSLSCSAQKSVEGIGFGAGMLFATMLVPFAFLISHYIARFWVEKENIDRLRRGEEIRFQRTALEDACREAQAKSSSEDAALARRSVHRAEFVRSLGSVNDFLDLLTIASGPEQAVRIKQGVAKELRDLVATHTKTQMIDLVATDEALATSLVATLDRLKEGSIQLEVVPFLTDVARSMLVPSSRST